MSFRSRDTRARILAITIVIGNWDFAGAWKRLLMRLATILCCIRTYLTALLVSPLIEIAYASPSTFDWRTGNDHGYSHRKVGGITLVI